MPAEKKRRGLKHRLKKLVGDDDSKKYRDSERAARAEAQKFNEQRQAHQNTITQAEREIQEMESAIRNLQTMQIAPSMPYRNSLKHSSHSQPLHTR